MPQQFVVPQFIDAEAKIMGPVTVRQFVILLVTAMIVAIIYALTSSMGVFIAAALPFVGIGLVVAFVKVNGQDFHYFVLNSLQTLRKPRLRVWQRDLSDKRLRLLAQGEPPPPPQVKIARKPLAETRRLQELSLVVNTGGMYRPETDDF